MLSALDTDVHSARLRDLRNDYRNQEWFMTRALINLQTELDAWQESHEPFDQGLCDDLKTEQTQRSIELSHVRLAMAGADEELASHQRRLRMHADRALDGLERENYKRLGA
jgi:hypothetical protein